MREESVVEEQLYLLLDREGGNEPFADGMTLDDIPIDVPSSVLPAKVESDHLFNENKDANSLVYQKWGVIVPKGERGAELFGYVADLVAWREKEQGMKVVPFEVEPDMDAAASVDWVVNTLSKIEKEDRPRYLLILGDLHEVSAELQIALSTRYFAGRLAFSTPDEYRAYVTKVIHYETVEPTAKQCKALVYSVRRSDSITQKIPIDHAEQKLINPLLRLSSERHEKGRIPVKFEWLNMSGTPRKEDLLEIVRSAPVPSLFLSVSHGHGAKSDRSETEKRSIQGALVFDGKVCLTAEDARSGPFLPGGFWFLFACFGAGTPKRSAYHHWLNAPSVLECLPKRDEPPYIAALPKAALANPEGPLAIVGHLDLAWSSSYDTAGFRNQVARFTELADIANKRDWRRVGPIFGDFIRDLVDINTTITNTVDAEKVAGVPQINERNRTRLWMLRQDLAAYILLGDPAAYLPFTRRVPRPAWANSDENEGTDE